jgi:hypothetical protein
MCFAFLVKVDHMVFKQKAYMSLSSSDRSYTDAISVDHQNCRLGKWYENEGRQLFGGLPSYKALEGPHAKVHNSVHAMIPCLSQGWEKSVSLQQKMYSALSDAEEASHEVMSLLDQLVREKHGNH